MAGLGKSVGLLIGAVMAMALQTGKVFQHIPFYRLFGQRGKAKRVRSSSQSKIVNTAFYGKAGYREYIRSKQRGWALQGGR